MCSPHMSANLDLHVINWHLCTNTWHAACLYQRCTHFCHLLPNLQILDKRAGPWPVAEATAFADVALKCVARWVTKRMQRWPDLRAWCQVFS